MGARLFTQTKDHAWNAGSINRTVSMWCPVFFMSRHHQIGDGLN